MSAALSREPEILDGEAATPSQPLAREILQALLSARREEFGEALTLAMRARESLPPQSALLAAMIDGFIDCQSRLRAAQRDLHEASRRFVLIEREQQERIDAIEAFLPRITLGSADEPPSVPPRDPEAARPPESAEDRSPVEGRLPPLAISCFGRFSVRRAGAPVPLCRNRNGQAILRYLAVHPRRRETGDALIEVLWPDDDPDTARHKLHVAISALRRALNGEYERQKGGGYLVYRDGCYGLNPAAEIEIDVDRFRAAIRAAQRGGPTALMHYRTACGLYTGVLLPEDLYADWCAQPREQLALDYLAAARALADAALAAGDFAEAEQRAAAILALSRSDEAAHQILLRVYAAQGRRSDVLRQYRLCERALREDLGVAPLAETAALVEAALRGDDLPAEGVDNVCA